MCKKEKNIFSECVATQAKHDASWPSRTVLSSFYTYVDSYLLLVQPLDFKNCKNLWIVSLDIKRKVLKVLRVKCINVKEMCIKVKNIFSEHDASWAKHIAMWPSRVILSIVHNVEDSYLLLVGRYETFIF